MKPFQQLLLQARRDRPRWCDEGLFRQLIWEELVEEAEDLHQQQMLDVIYGNDILMEEVEPIT